MMLLSDNTIATLHIREKMVNFTSNAHLNELITPKHVYVFAELWADMAMPIPKCFKQRM